MATHHILCVHGIGVHDNDWVRKKEDAEPQTFEELVEEKWEKYPALKGDFSKKVKLHSVHYDDEINRIFQSWKQQAADLKKALASSPALQNQFDWFTGIVDEAGAPKKQADWRYTHLMDLLMVIGSPTLQDRLVTRVARQIVDLVNDAEEDDDVSLIAHSMGCAMAHKALQALYNEGVETPQGRQTLRGDFRFVNVTMVANTSYCLSRDKDGHYKGIVRPSAKVGGGCCTTWINVNHRVDPVGRFLPFDYRKNPDWLEPFVAAKGWHQDIPLTRISSKDIHSLTHYFRDPSFHIPFFELAFGVDFSDQQLADALKEFEAETPVGKFKTLLSHLESEKLDMTKAGDDYRKFFEALRDFFGLTKK